jgi:hypothetical protein
MHRVEGFLGFGAQFDERSDLVRFYVSRSSLGKLYKWSDAFFQWSDLVRFLFLFFCASSGNITRASPN